MREEILRADVHQRGGWGWRDSRTGAQTSSLTYEVNTLDVTDPWLRLSYTLTRSGEQADYHVRLTTTRPRFGGLRWWFLCPLSLNGRTCGRRVAKLYLPPRDRYFGCRHCHDLTYTSCQESHKFDGLYRLLAQNTGMDIGMVKRALDRIGPGR